MTTVAEGMEQFEQFMALRRIGCDVGQGFYFSRPVPADEASRLLDADAETAWPKNVGVHPSPPKPLHTSHGVPA